MVLQAAAGALQLLAGIFLARSLLPEGRGAYALVVLIPNTCLTIANLGFGAAATRQVAQQPEVAGRVVANAVAFALLSGGATALLLLAFLPQISAFVGDERH